jgi:predicted DNA-binding protein
MKDINYNREAFLHPWNLTFLIAAMAVAFGVSMAGATWPFDLVLMLTTGLELVYLGTMPRNERFRRAVRSRKAVEHAKPPSQKELFQNLEKGNQRRYARLRKIESDIRVNYRKLSYASQGMLDSHLSKINGLLDSYLKLLYQKERYEFSGSSATETQVQRTIDMLHKDMQDDTPRVRAIKERRLKILEQRLERSQKGAENLEIIEAQLETIEDVIKYIEEQSLTLRNPDEISFQLDTLLSEVEETQASVVELEEVFANPTDLLNEMDTFEDPTEIQTPESTGTTRTRE